MLMLKTVTVLEAISKRRRTARPAAHTGLSKNTIFAATHSAEDALVLLDATANGLTVEQATERLNAVGPNTIEATTKTLDRRIADAFIDPFAGILAALALVSLYIDVLAVPEPQRDPSTVIVIGIMLLVSGGMKFIQEARSGNAAEALKDLVSNTCTALRDGGRIEIPFDELVPGDVIRLSAGDMVPADARIITARDLFVIESALTGESEAVEKTTAVTVVEGADGSALPLSACKNIVFTGTSVQNGAAMALVVATGSDTYLGGIAKMLNGRGEKSAFDRGVSSVSMLLVRLMLVMAPAVFAINAATKGNVIDALLFATSVAVGITPQMLPVIVTTSLSQGAKDLARRQVIVKELPAIQNLGAMDVLCCDKTGTLTEDRIVLERYLNTDGNEDARVLRHAFLNSFFQTGLKNLIDLAVIDRADVTPSTVAPDSMLGQSLRDRYTKVDEVPFDFSRRRLSVVVADAQGKTQMVTKGAAEEMLEICSFVEIDGIAQPLTDEKLAQIRKQIADLKWEAKDATTVTITAEDESHDLKLKDDKLVLEVEGDKLIFTKSDKDLSGTVKKDREAAEKEEEIDEAVEDDDVQSVEISPAVTVADDDLCTITITEKFKDDWGDIGFVVNITNKSDKNLTFYAPSGKTNVNGTMKEPWFSAHLMPGTNATEEFTFSNGELDSLDDLVNTTIGIDAYLTDSYEDVASYSATIA